MATNERRDAAIRELRAYRSDLLSQVEQLQLSIHHVEKSIELLSGTPIAEAASPVQLSGSVAVSSGCVGTLSTGSSPYAGMTPQDAVERFMREHPGKWYKAREVAQELEDAGVQSQAKIFRSGIASAMKRAAVKKGLLLREKRGEHLMYKLKNGDAGETDDTAEHND